MLEAFPVTDFWLKGALSYPEISKTALKKGYCHSALHSYANLLFQLLNVKTKQRNPFEIQQDIRCFLSSTEPRIKNLVANVKAHPSH